MKLQGSANIVRLIFACLMFFTCALYVFFKLGPWLVVSNPPPPSLDVLYSLSGEDARIIYAKKLFPTYPNARRLISCPPGMRGDTSFQRWAKANCVTTVDTCANTRSEIAFLKNAIMQGLSRRSLPADTTLKIGIISNWYHMRRVQLIVNTQLSHKRCRFYYLPVTAQIDPYVGGIAGWWKHSVYRNVVFTEWEKIVLYWLQHIV